MSTIFQTIVYPGEPMPVFIVLLSLFIGVPLMELYVLIKVGGEIGALNTVALVIFTAFVGAFLLRQQGLSTLMRYQASLQRGEVPAMEMLEGLVLLVGGGVLLLPGFITDFLGLLCLIPQTRQALVRYVLRHAQHHVHVHHPHAQPGQRTLEGEFERRDD